MDQPQLDLVKLKLSSKIGKKPPVFMADFSNGRIDPSSEIEFECFKSEEKESMIESGYANRKLVATNGHLTYIGESNDKPTLQYFIGVRNKNSGKMKLYDSTHFRLKPVIKSNDVVVNTDKEKNYWEDRNRLTEEFGGKAQKRILKSRLKLKTEALEDLLNDESINMSPAPPDPFADSPSNTSYLPSVNRITQSLDEVYNINEIIPPEVDARLQDYVNSWLVSYQTNANAAKQNFCQFVLQRIDENLDNVKKVKYLLYYNYLVAFQCLTYNDLRKKDPAPNIPDQFKRILLENFTLTTKSDTGRTSRSISPQQKDKMTAHIIVLALLINDYSVSMSHILMDLKRVYPKTCTTIARALGCSIASKKVGDQNENFIELKFPLNVVLSTFKKRQF